MKKDWFELKVDLISTASFNSYDQVFFFNDDR